MKIWWMIPACLNFQLALAVDSADIQAAYTQLKRACGNTTGRGVSKECMEAAIRVQENSDQLNREIFQSMQQREQERQRIQLEEMWREQVRRRYR